MNGAAAPRGSNLDSRFRGKGREGSFFRFFCLTVFCFAVAKYKKTFPAKAGIQIGLLLYNAKRFITLDFRAMNPPPAAVSVAAASGGGATRAPAADEKRGAQSAPNAPAAPADKAQAKADKAQTTADKAQNQGGKKTAAAGAPPPKPPKAKKSGGGFFGRFLLFMMSAGALFAAAAAWREAQDLRIETARATQTAGTGARRAADENAAKIDATRKTAAQISARLDNLESQIDSLRKTARATKADLPLDGIDLRLALVDLRLHADGDTAAAARAVDALARAKGLRPDESAALTAAAARLKETPSRARVVSEIESLVAILRDPPKTALSGAGWRGVVADLFQIRRDANADAREIFAAARDDLQNAALAARARDDSGLGDSLAAARRRWRQARAHLSPEAAATGDVKMSVLESLQPPFYRLPAR